MGGSNVKSLRLQDDLVTMFETVCKECGFEQRRIMESMMWEFVTASADRRQEITREWALSLKNNSGIWEEFEATNPHIRRKMTQDPSEIERIAREKPMGTTRKGGSRGKAD